VIGELETENPVGIINPTDETDPTPTVHVLFALKSYVTPLIVNVRVTGT
jgi:hypothetical protein